MLRTSRQMAEMCPAAWAGRACRGGRGQALIVAVLVLFAVATLAALFVAIVSSQLVQVTRHSDVVALRNIAEAGLWLANERLTYSMEGADWRPRRTPYRFGHAEVTVRVTYGPSPAEPQSRFVRVVSTAVFPDNPFLRDTMLALKPVLLTDYARFFTDRYETNRPARLGVTGVELGGQARKAGDISGSYDPYDLIIDGPVRSNTDLIVCGRTQIYLHSANEVVPGEGPLWRRLGILRDDRIEVAGWLLPDPNRPAWVWGNDYLKLTIDGADPRAEDLFVPTDEDGVYDYETGFLDREIGGASPKERVLANLPNYERMGVVALNPGLAVPRVQPPEIDATHPDLQTNRYLLLTRESGQWREVLGRAYNTGEHGWGWTNFGGIYIDNGPWKDEFGQMHPGDIQYDHNLAMLKLNWLRSVGAHDDPGQPVRVGDERPDPDGTLAPLSGPADWWDETGRHYAPPAVEIVLHGEASCPYVEIIRHDKRTLDGIEYYWREPGGTPIPAAGGLYEYAPAGRLCAPGAGGPLQVGIWEGNRAIFPFPPNGVIYAEGNVRIRGIEPTVRDEIGRVGEEIPAEGVSRVYFDFDRYGLNKGRARRFDLQVVSGGTIYIEGDLLTPEAAGLITNDYAAAQVYGSRLALLARDHVCVNTTALNPRPQDLYRVVDDDGVNRYYNDAQRQYPTGYAAHPRHLLWQGENYPLVSGITDYTHGTWLDTDPNSTTFEYNNVRLGSTALRAELDAWSDLRLILGHAGWYVPRAGEDGEGASRELDDTAAGARVTLSINGQRVPWDGGAYEYEFVPPPPGNRDESGAWILDTAPSILEFLPDVDQSMPLDIAALTGADGFTFTPEVRPVATDDDGDAVDPWVLPPKDLGYVLGPLAVAPPRGAEPLPVQIQAMMYAQNGSWFVIPGPWFNDDPAKAEYAFDCPGYHEPLNIHISVHGAITENVPADLGTAVEWTSKWGGPFGQGENGFLSYQYDPLLRWARWDPESETDAPRFPNLPMTSDLLIWGERVSGQAGD